MRTAPTSADRRDGRGFRAWPRPELPQIARIGYDGGEKPRLSGRRTSAPGPTARPDPPWLVSSSRPRPPTALTPWPRREPGRPDGSAAAARRRDRTAARPRPAG